MRRTLRDKAGPTPQAPTEQVDCGDGLRLEVNPDGSRYWTLETSGPGNRKLIVGTHPELGITDAKARAQALLDVIERSADLPVIVPPLVTAAVPDGDSGRYVTPAAVGKRIDAARRAFVRASLAISGAVTLPGAAFARSGPVPRDAEDSEDEVPEDDPDSDPPTDELYVDLEDSTASQSPPAAKAKAWIQYPKTFGASSYVRYSPINVVRGTIDVELRSTHPLKKVVIQAMGRSGELARSPVLQKAPFVWTLDTRKLPEGNVVLDAELDVDIPFLHAVVVVDNDQKPVTGQQWVPVGARNTLDEFNSAAWGYEWVRHPAANAGAHLTVRPGIPFGERKSKKDLWQQAMTSTSITRYNSSRQFTTLEGGHISVVERQAYTQTDNFKLNVGNCIDGPYGVGRVGSMWNGYVDSQGALVAITGQGRGVRIDLTGRTETLIGPRLKAGVAAPILLPSATPTQLNWLESFYEHVGAIVDGPPTLSNPWQIVADPKNEDMLYIADSDNNRLVIYDVKTKIGRTLAGGIEGFADGLGTTARFNRPRGLAWSLDGETLYIADDHNSAIRAINRQGVVYTVVRSARGTNYDLVLREGEFKKMQEFADMIRSYMKDGAFGTANFMHPNALGIDSEGNLLAACHHPHVVVKFDLKAKTVQTLVKLPLSVLQIHRLALAWVSISVDRWGAFGPKDQFGVAYWMQGSYRLYNKDGSAAGYYLGPDKPSASGYLENGPASECKYTSYPAFCVFGRDGSMWHGGTAGDGVYRQTLRRPGDPVINAALYKRGFALYTTGVPAPMYRRGWRGHSHVGETSFYDFAQKSDAEIAAWIKTWPTQYSKDDIAALVYFIRWQA